MWDIPFDSNRFDSISFHSIPLLYFVKLKHNKVIYSMYIAYQMSSLDKLAPGSAGVDVLSKKAAAGGGGAGAGAGDSDIEDEELELSVAETDDESGTEAGSESDADETGSESAGAAAEDDADSDADTEGGGGGADEEGAEGGDDEEGGGGGGAGLGAAAAAKLKKANKKRGATKKNIEDDLTLLGIPHGLTFEDDDDDSGDDSDDPDNAEYFQKLKSGVRDSFVATYHPESFSHNYDEIQTLSRVVRNSAGVIVDDLHKTIPIMTKYEKTRILGQRAKQLNEGAQPFIKIDSTVIDGYLIAMKELEQKKTPFIIRRPLPNGGSEYWRIQDLEIL
jgi:DNA-directed RNA polymerase I, II, and III subunit RPABC2